LEASAFARIYGYYPSFLSSYKSGKTPEETNGVLDLFVIENLVEKADKQEISCDI
jgi:hypothetical protein